MSRKSTEKKPRRGRPRKQLHLEDYAALGPPPREDVLAIGHWLQRIVALTAHQARHGRGSDKVRHGIRSSCMAAARLLPSAITARALGLAQPGDIDPSSEPPDDPLQVSEWFLLNLVDDVHRQITGTADAKVSAEWRSASQAAVKVWPPDLVVEARRMLRESLGQLDTTAGAVETELLDDPDRPGSLNFH